MKLINAGKHAIANQPFIICSLGLMNLMDFNKIHI